MCDKFPIFNTVLPSHLKNDDLPLSVKIHVFHLLSAFKRRDNVSKKYIHRDKSIQKK